MVFVIPIDPFHHSDAGGIYLFIITPLIPPLCYSNYLSSLSFRPQKESAHSFLFIILIIHPPSNSTFHSCCHSNSSSLCHSDYSLPLSFRRRRNLFIHHHSTYSPLCYSNYLSSLSFRRRKNRKNVIYRIPITEPIHSIHFQMHQ